MHLTRRVGHGRAHNFTDRLQTQTDAQDRHSSLNCGAQHRHHLWRVLGTTRPRADDQRIITVENSRLEPWVVVEQHVGRAAA